MYPHGKVTLLLCFLLGVPLIGQSFRYSVYLGGTPSHIVVDAKGYVLAAGWTGADLFVARLDPHGNIVYRVTIKDDSAIFYGVASDAAGNAYVTGTTVTGAFPILNALQPNPPDKGSDQSFVAKLDPSGAMQWATYIGGKGGAWVRAIATDAAGNVYITGQTTAPDFPVTPGAFQSTGGGSPSQNGGRPASAFVAKLTTAGDRLIYATYLGGRTTTGCSGPGPCIGRIERGTALAVDLLGNAYVAGLSNAIDFPITAGAFQKDCHCANESLSPFVAKLNGSGTALLYSTFLGGNAGGPYVSDSIGGIVVDEAGAAYATGQTDDSSFPVTPDAFQNHFTGSSSSFVTKLNPSGTGLEYSTYWGGSVSSIAVDSQGNAWLGGGTDSADYPDTVGVFKQGGAFVTELNAQGKALLFSLRLPGGVGGALALDSKGGAYLGGPYLSHLDLLVDSDPSIVEVITAAYSNVAMKSPVAQSISPGELVSILGFRIGPAAPATAQLDGDGRFATALASVRVFFDELAAPLLYVQGNQINAVTPFGIAGRPNVKIHVELNGVPSPAIDVPVADTEPEIFVNMDFWAAALNEDGTLNTAVNPAKPGSIVVCYATGVGVTAPPSLDGQPSIQSYPKPLAPLVPSWDGGQPAEVLYLGAAPGMIAGVFQINVRLLPEYAPPGRGYRLLFLRVGNSFTAGVAVHVMGPPLP